MYWYNREGTLKCVLRCLSVVSFIQRVYILRFYCILLFERECIGIKVV